MRATTVAWTPLLAAVFVVSTLSGAQGPPGQPAAALAPKPGPSSEALHASPPPPSQQPTPRQAQFVEPMEFYTREGGTWSSPNSDYDFARNPIRTFGYRFAWLVPRVVVRLTIFGRSEVGPTTLSGRRRRAGIP